MLIDTAGRYTTQDSDAKADKAELARVPRPAEEKPAAPADQRRARRHQHRRHPDAAAAGDSHAHADAHSRCACSSCIRGSRSVPGLRAIHQGRSGRRLHRVFRYLDEAGRRQVWGATFQTADKTRIWSAADPGRVRPSAGAAERGDARPSAGRADARSTACNCSAFRHRWRG